MSTHKPSILPNLAILVIAIVIGILVMSLVGCDEAQEMMIPPPGIGTDDEQVETENPITDGSEVTILDRFHDYADSDGRIDSQVMWKLIKEFELNAYDKRNGENEYFLFGEEVFNWTIKVFNWTIAVNGLDSVSEAEEYLEMVEFDDSLYEGMHPIVYPQNYPPLTLYHPKLGIIEDDELTIETLIESTHISFINSALPNPDMESEHWKRRIEESDFNPDSSEYWMDINTRDNLRFIEF